MTKKGLKCSPWPKYDRELLKVLTTLLPRFYSSSSQKSLTLEKALLQSVQQTRDLRPHVLRSGVKGKPNKSNSLRRLVAMIPLEFFEDHDANVVNQVILGTIRFFWVYLNNRIHGEYFIPAEPYTQVKVRGSALTDPAARPSSWSPPPSPSPKERSDDQDSWSRSWPGLGDYHKAQPQSSADGNTQQKSPNKALDGSRDPNEYQPSGKDNSIIFISSEEDNESSVLNKGQHIKAPDKSLPSLQEQATPVKKRMKHSKSATVSEQSSHIPDEQDNPSTKNHSNFGPLPTESLHASPDQDTSATHAKKHDGSIPIRGSAAAPIVVDAPEDSDSCMIKREPTPLFLPTDAVYSGGLGNPKKRGVQSARDSGLRSSPNTSSQPQPANQPNSAAQAEQSSEGDEDQSSESEEEQSSESEAEDASDSDSEDSSESGSDEPPEEEVTASLSIDHSGKKRKRSVLDNEHPKKKNKKDTTGKHSVVAPEPDRTPKHPHSSVYSDYQAIAFAPIEQPKAREKITNKAGREQQKPILRANIYESMYQSERAKTSRYETIFKEVGITADMLAEMSERLMHGSTPATAVNTVKQWYKKHG